MKARWEKVSFEEYAKGKNSNEAASYNSIVLPYRATKGSAGYDIATPIALKFPEDSGKVVDLGIRIFLPIDEVLLVMPRSGLGFKYNMRLANTVGVIDSDYYNSDNEGHIKVKLLCDVPCEFNAGDRICQGIIVNYDTAEEEEITKSRNGGFGSTN